MAPRRASIRPGAAARDEIGGAENCSMKSARAAQARADLRISVVSAQRHCAIKRRALFASGPSAAGSSDHREPAFQVGDDQPAAENPRFRRYAMATSLTRPLFWRDSTLPNFSAANLPAT